MRVEFSKEFEKAVRKLSGKMLESVREAVQEVIDAENIEELTDYGLIKSLSGHLWTNRYRFCPAGNR